MGSINPENILGKRIVNYLKNEALIGRIGKQKIQLLSSTLGITTQLRSELGALDDEDSGAHRSQAMGGLLSQWCSVSGPRSVPPDSLGLATALESARLSYHAQEVRTMAPTTQSATTENSKPLVMHSPTASPQPTSPKKIANFSESLKSQSKERGGNSQSDSGVFTSDSSKENEEKEEKKGKGKPKRVVKRKLISYRVKPRNKEVEQLESTDGSLDLKEKAELPPVKTKHTLQLKERQNFQSPRTPQKLPSIHTEVKDERLRGGSRMSTRSVAQSIDKLTSRTEKKLQSHKSSGSRRGQAGGGELINNERKKIIPPKSSRLRPLPKQPKRLTDRRKPPEERDSPGSVAGNRIKSSKRRRSFGRRRSREVEQTAPTTADTVITDVRGSKSETTLPSKNLNSDEEDLLSRSASIPKIPSSRRKSRDRRHTPKVDPVAEKTEEDPHSEAEDKVLTLLKLDETFTRDDFGNKQFSASSNSPRKLARSKSKISVRSNSSIRSESSKSSLSNCSRSNDLIKDSIETIMEEKDFVNHKSLPELIRRKVRSDKYIRSLCSTDQWFRVNYLSALLMFGPRLKLTTRTQALVWIILCRVGYYWSKNIKTPPTEEEILNDRASMRFVLNLSKLCYNLVKTDQVQVTAVQEVKVKDDKSETVLNFEQFGVSLPRLRLTNFEIAVFQEKNPFNDPLGHYVECNFYDRPIVEMLSSIYVHVYDEDMGDFSQSDLTAMLPLLCGISSQTKEKEQNLVRNFVATIVSTPVQKEPEYYLHKKLLQDIWISSPSPLLLFSALYEARLKTVHDKHPSSETELNFFETRLEIHHLVTICHYLSQIDRKHVRINAFIAKDCDLNNESLSLLAEKLWRMKTVILTNNRFSEKGVGQLTSIVEKEENNFSLDVLDLSNCNLGDPALERLAVLIDFVKELNLTDNTFSSQGIRAFSAAHSASRRVRLKKLDMSRTNVGKTGFYELIPVLLGTEQITFQGNPLSPLELKEFATKLKEEESPKIKSLDISSTSLSNESMPQIVCFINLIENIDLHNSEFSAESMKTLVTAIQENGIGKLKALNLRLCKLNDACLEILSEIIPLITSINLSSNNFSGNSAVKTLCTKIEKTEKASLKFLDMKYSRLSQDMKKSLGEVCKNKNIELKVW